MILRPTAPADLPALHDVFVTSMRALFEPHALEPAVPPLEVFCAQQQHLLDTGGLCVVAERDGVPIAFASAWTRGDDWFLASLFVAPAVQAAGLGRTLLDAVWGTGVTRRRTITDAFQPVSNALYGRRGLVPVTPILTFDGVPSVTRPSALEPSELGAAELAHIDEAAYGFDRAVDHAYWSGVAERRGWLRAGEPAAYAYLFPGQVDPMRRSIPLHRWRRFEAGSQSCPAACACAFPAARGRSSARRSRRTCASAQRLSSCCSPKASSRRWPWRSRVPRSF